MESSSSMLLTGHLIGRKPPPPQYVPTTSDWDALRPEIERLYVRERRKLRHVMQHMEAKHGFKATQQMYKKRFVKWGIQKNSRQSVASTPASVTTVSTKASPSTDLDSVPGSPIFSDDESQKLVFLTSVHTWSMSFYESLRSNHETAVATRQTWPDRCDEMNITFKLAVDMLNRGHGSLAGRLIRKAFLSAEEILVLEGPALVWNMLENMYYLLLVGQKQLVKLLLIHLTGLVNGRMPKTHPLPVMLQILRVLATSPGDTGAFSDNPLPSSWSSSSPVAGSGAKALNETWLGSDMLLSVLERAWTLNAEMIFDRFDHRLFQVYFRVHWESCSIEPPTAMIDAARQWLAQGSSLNISSSVAKAAETGDFIEVIPFDQDRLVQRMFAAPIGASPPRSYELLRASSMSMLHDRINCILTQNSCSGRDAIMLMRILASLVATKVLEQWPIVALTPDNKTGEMPTIPRIQASNVACAFATSIELDGDPSSSQAPWNVVEKAQALVALREYASGETDPRLLQEMWQLGDALLAAGEHEKASKAKQTAYQRLETYLEDVPVYVV